MAKLRHVAMSVPTDDVEKTVEFYTEVFGMRRVHQSPLAVILSDDVVSLAIISDKISLNRGHHGLHHIGFIVDDIGEARKRISSTGIAEAIDDNLTAGVTEEIGGVRPSTGDGDIEHKFKDPNGVTFDIANDEYATRGWGVSLR